MKIRLNFLQKHKMNNNNQDVLRETSSIKRPKVIQLLPTLSYGDAVGNETLCIDKILRLNGFETQIYAVNWHEKLSDLCKHYRKLNNIDSDDIIIYHFSTGCKELANLIRNTICKKIMIYHNITPSCFFLGYNDELCSLVESGREELKELRLIFDYCLADSEYNKKELESLGYKQKIDVMPLILPFDDYDKAMDVEVLEKYATDEWTNILFVGRIVPNKKQEDLISIFAYYKKYVNEKSRLFLVGNWNGMEEYHKKLVQLIDELSLKDVIFPGHISFNSILAYYNLADVFLCMSEHEGFCVPLIEAMYFDIPIIAYNSSAIPFVLDSSGIIVHDKNEKKIASLINKIVKDEDYRNFVINAERIRLDSFLYKKTSLLFLNYIKSFIDSQC